MFIHSQLLWTDPALPLQEKLSYSFLWQQRRRQWWHTVTTVPFSSGLLRSRLPLFSHKNITVDVRNVQTCREFLWVYLSQIDNNCWEAKSQWIEKMCCREWQCYSFFFFTMYRIHYNQRRKEGGLQEILLCCSDGRLRRQEKAKQENLCGWIKGETEKNSFTLVSMGR